MIVSHLNLSKEEIEKKIINGEKPYWRFKLSQKKIVWNDLVKGNTEVDLSSQSDPSSSKSRWKLSLSFSKCSR
jgi:glutamyl/glutaminyl-tRNA synthetase